MALTLPLEMFNDVVEKALPPLLASMFKTPVGLTVVPAAPVTLSWPELRLRTLFGRRWRNRPSNSPMLAALAGPVTPAARRTLNDDVGARLRTVGRHGPGR